MSERGGEILPVDNVAHLLRRAHQPGDGDTRCQVCGRANPMWFADNEIWNLVVGGPDAKGDPGGVLCPCCFIYAAQAQNIRVAWHLTLDAQGAPK